jgi:hypothetical protein
MAPRLRLHVILRIPKENQQSKKTRHSISGTKKKKKSKIKNKNKLIQTKIFLPNPQSEALKPFPHPNPRHTNRCRR